MDSIIVRGVAKTFTIHEDARARLYAWLRPGSPQRTVEALQPLDLDVPPGECIGLLGANGSGKTTLLRLLAGTTAPTRGSIEIHGTVGCLLELGAGFHRAFTGRENILMTASLLGMSRAEAEARLPGIVDFSELGEFIDAPLRTYSAGMACRLAFSVATAQEPDVLLVDEVLGVGDLRFQEKCADRIRTFKARGATIVLASHSLPLIREICDRALWLQRGEVRAEGPPNAVVQAYIARESQIPEESAEPAAKHDAKTPTDGPNLLSADLLLDGNTQPTNMVRPGDTLTVQVAVDNPDAPRNLVVAVTVARQEGLLCFAVSTDQDNLECRFERATVRLTLPSLQLLSGTYRIEAYLYDEKRTRRLDQRCVAPALIVEADSEEYGLIRHDHDWAIDAGE